MPFVELSTFSYLASQKGEIVCHVLHTKPVSILTICTSFLGLSATQLRLYNFYAFLVFFLLFIKNATLHTEMHGEKLPCASRKKTSKLYHKIIGLTYCI